MIELKKCPFCGGEAQVEQTQCGQIDHSSVGIYFDIRCKKCNATAPGSMEYVALNLSKTGELNVWHNGMEKAIEAWNRRPV